MGAFNAIDLETDGIITKKNFVYSVTSAINKMISQSSIKKSNSGSFEDPNFHRSGLSNIKKLGGSSGIDPIQETSNSKPFK